MSNVSLNGVARIDTNLGSFLGRTYDPSLLQVLGVPDADGKDLTTLLTCLLYTSPSPRDRS